MPRRKAGPPEDPASRMTREGFWRMILRVHHGIPGFKGTGFVSSSGTQFTGGMAGVTTAWPLAPYGMPVYEAIPVAGFYSFGPHWVDMLRTMGMERKRFEQTALALEKEFGMIPEEELRKGTEPVPAPQPRLFPPLLGARDPGPGPMVPGVQFEVAVQGARFKVVYTQHFVDRFQEDGDRPAVARFLSRDAVEGEIVRALPFVFEILEYDPEAEGIVVSRELGLSMKFYAIPIPGGWQLNMATMIVAAPLRRRSPREVMISLNSESPVSFPEGMPEDLEIAALGDVWPFLLDLEDGETREIPGELTETLVGRVGEGFQVLGARWAGREPAVVEG